MTPFQNVIVTSGFGTFCTQDATGKTFASLEILSNEARPASEICVARMANLVDELQTVKLRNVSVSLFRTNNLRHPSPVHT